MLAVHALAQLHPTVKKIVEEPLRERMGTIMKRSAISARATRASKSACNRSS
jgi:hypothetical protein